MLKLSIKKLNVSKILVEIYQNDPLILIQSHISLARVYQDLEYKEQALDHFKQSLKNYYVYYDNEDDNLPLLFEI